MMMMCVENVKMQRGNSCKGLHGQFMKGGGVGVQQISGLHGTVQQKLRWVKSGINR
jgi:hypothetical protein